MPSALLLVLASSVSQLGRPLCRCLLCNYLHVYVLFTLWNACYNFTTNRLFKKGKSLAQGP